MNTNADPEHADAPSLRYAASEVAKLAAHLVGNTRVDGSRDPAVYEQGIGCERAAQMLRQIAALCERASSQSAGLRSTAPTPPADAHNWTEDFAHENGRYQSTCVNCGHAFIGHKRRVWCKVCAQGCATSSPPADAPEPPWVVAARELKSTSRATSEVIRLACIAHAEAHAAALAQEVEHLCLERDVLVQERTTLQNSVHSLQRDLNRLTAERDSATRHAQILSNGRVEVLATVERLTAERDRYRAALEFYADPENYFGIAFLPDPPCGAFAEDFEEMSGDLSHPDGQPWTKPGKLARAALAPTQKEEA